MFTTEEQYLEWLRNVWAGDRWMHLPGYSPTDVAKLGQRYAWQQSNYRDALLQSFDAYHAEVLKPWVGSKFFSSERPRIGIYLREYPLPCVDRMHKTLLPGHGGTQKLPADVMAESVRAVLNERKRRAYKTLSRALVGALEIVQTTFGVAFEGLEDFTKHIVVADWIRPFALFKTPTGAPFLSGLSKSSCHRREMYEFGAKLFAKEIGIERLNLDIVIVMGLGMFELPAAKITDAMVWPPRPAGGRFRTLTTRPASWAPRGSRKVLVLPHPAVGDLFRKALRTMTDGRALQESFSVTSSSGLQLAHDQEILLEQLTDEVVNLRGPGELIDVSRSNYRRLSWCQGPSFFLQIRAGAITVKTKVPANSISAAKSGAAGLGLKEWKPDTKTNNFGVDVPTPCPAEQREQLFALLFRLLAD